MFSPVESIPINDIEIMKPSMNKYSTTVSEEMLIVDEKSRNCFEDLTGCLNPFRLTTYPRICSYYDVKSAKDNLDVFNAVVDVVCFYQGINSKQIDVRVPIRGSGFLVAPPNKLDTIWEYYFVTCLHNTLPFEYEYNNEVVQLSLRMMKGILGKNHRFEPLSTRSMNCTILAKSGLKEDEKVKKHPNNDWVLMKMEVPIGVVLDEQYFPESYLIPSPSKLNPQSEHDYNMSILSFQGMPTEKDVTTLEQHLDYHTNLIALKSMFELECKNISFGKFVDTNEKTCKYNASSFPGSSGGAVVLCCENYSNWRDFKENVILDRSVIGIHTGSEENLNRCCPVSYWFKAFYDHVFVPMKGNFTTEEIERIEMENGLNNI